MDMISKLFPVSCIKNLSHKSKGDSILVGVVQMVNETFTHYKDQRLIILADESGARIGATVPNHLFAQFDIVTKEQWYSIAKYRVEVRPHYLKWTEHKFHIFFNEDTVCDLIEKKKDEPFQFLVPIHKLLDGSAYDKHNVVDVLGGVVKVEKLTDDVEVVFWLNDYDGTSKRVKCVARGELATKFENLWITNEKRGKQSGQSRSRESTKKWAIFVLLKNWIIEDDEEEAFYLRSHSLYSHIEVDTSLPIIEDILEVNELFPVIHRLEEDGYEEPVAPYPHVEFIFYEDPSIWDSSVR